MSNALNDEALDMLFRKARSHNGWQDIPVTDEQIQRVYDLMKMGPTAANSCPARIVFVKTPEGKEKLLPCVNPGNVEKCRTAPVVAVIGMDLEFYEFLPKLFPHTDARSWYVGQPELIHNNAFRNSSLQAAYFMMAVRSLGLDAGPMTGFNADKMNETFFPDGKVKVNMMCAIGYGDPAKLFPRNPRLDFDEACRII